MFIVFAEMFTEMFTENHVNIYVPRTWVIFGLGLFYEVRAFGVFTSKVCARFSFTKDSDGSPPPLGVWGPAVLPPSVGARQRTKGLLSSQRAA